jgi:hypothetical protein
MMGMIRAKDTRLYRCALLVIGLTWLPLALLSALQQFFGGDGAFNLFLRDFGAHARFLVAAPLLVIGQSWCLTRLSESALCFSLSGIVRPEDRRAFEAHLASTSRGLNSIWAEVFGIILAYIVVIALLPTVFAQADLPKWQLDRQNGGTAFSPAGYWQLLVSLPLLTFQLYGWVWRHVMWCRLLILTSRLPLRLIAAHPDRSGGLRFLSTALRGYWPLCFALGMIVAGRAANALQTGTSIYDFRFTVLALLGILLGFILIPTLVFTPSLIHLREEGTLLYGSLAHTLGERFEAKWLKNSEPVSPSMLEAPDFSSTADLYSIAANVPQIQFFPVMPLAILELILVTLAPFVPVVLAFLPLDTIPGDLRKILM